MQITQKCQYALRAIFELAKRSGKGPVKIAEVAEAQDIPPRFLEVILSQLKQGGFVASQRGAEGGYVLLRQPDELSVGEVMRFLQGPIGPVDCLLDGKKNCALFGNCVFLPMWEKVAKAMTDVYDSTSFQDLVENERRQGAASAASYSI